MTINTEEVSATSPRGRTCNSGIATGEAISSDGEGKWEDDLGTAFAKPTVGVKISIPKNIDPAGLFSVALPALIVEAPAPATAPAEPARPPLMSIQEANSLGIIHAPRYEIDVEDVKDVKVGQETLVLNTTLMSSPDQLAEASEVHVTDQVSMLQQISTPSDVETKYTATLRPFIVPDQPTNTDISPTAPIVIPIPKLVEPALERAQKRLAVEKDPESRNQAGPSS